MTPCACGCGQPAAELHHAPVRQQTLRRASRDREHFTALRGDPRGMIPLALTCHRAVTAAQRKLPLSVLPDEAFTFAVEALGAGPAWCEIRRWHDGEDPRLDALVDQEEAA